MRPFNAASLHKACTYTLLSSNNWEPGDGFCSYGQVQEGKYRISTYHDFCHNQKDKLSPYEILKRGMSLISIQIHRAGKDALVVHPKDLMTEGNYAQRGYMMGLVEIFGKQPDLNTPVVYDPNALRLITPAKDPWLQSIFDVLMRQVG